MQVTVKARLQPHLGVRQKREEGVDESVRGIVKVQARKWPPVPLVRVLRLVGKCHL